MNRLESLLIMCASSEYIESFTYMPQDRIFNCIAIKEYDSELFIFSFNETLTNVCEYGVESYENLLCILKGRC